MFITTVKLSNGTDAEDNITIPSDRTIRSLFEEYGMPYERGVLQFNGVFVGNDKLDATLESLVTNPDMKQIINMEVKSMNAAEACAVINGGAMVITSTATPEELATIHKYRPEALKLTEGEGANKKTLFTVGLVDGEGAISQKGAFFSKSRTNAEGKATITVILPDDVTDVKEWAQDVLGIGILYLRKTEAQFSAMLDDVKQERDAVAAAITVA